MSMIEELPATGAVDEQLAFRIKMRIARVAVIGLGYVGLPLAETFAWGGYPVVGFDIDSEKIKKLKTGRSYIGHISSSRVAELISTGRFEPTSNPRCFEDVDAVIICVPTPLTEAREPDLTYITGTGKMLSKHLHPGHLVILESTTYPGTTVGLLQPILEESGLKAGRDFFLAFSPEREDPGNPSFSTRSIPKVVGGIDDNSRDLAVSLYEPVVEGVIPVSSTQVAEACKILENTYRAVNIALVNELKIVFDAMGIDVWEVIAAAKTKPFGFQAFYPGPGLGGHCIPIDPFYLTWIAHKYGRHTRLIELAGEINSGMPEYVVQRLADALNARGKAVKGAKVLLMGLAYKKDVDDPRESPAFKILTLLMQKGALADYSDPYFPHMPSMRNYQFRADSVDLTPEAVRSYDAVLLVTDHSAFPYAAVHQSASLIIDTRNAFGERGLAGAHVVRA